MPRISLGMASAKSFFVRNMFLIDSFRLIQFSPHALPAGRPWDRLPERDRLPEIRRAIGIPGERLRPWRSAIPTALVRFGVRMINDPVLFSVRGHEKSVVPRRPG